MNDHRLLSMTMDCPWKPYRDELVRIVLLFKKFKLGKLKFHMPRSPGNHSTSITLTTLGLLSYCPLERSGEEPTRIMRLICALLVVICTEIMDIMPGLQERVRPALSSIGSRDARMA